MSSHNRTISSLLSVAVLTAFAALAAGSGSSGDPAAPAAPGAVGSAPAAAQRHGLDTAVRLGDTSVTVSEVTLANQVGGQIFNETAGPGATFVVVRYQETNHGNETLTVLGSPFKLLDAQGRRFEPSSRGEGALAANEGLQLIPQLQPGLASTGVAVFEVPAATATGTVQLEFQERGFLGSGRATFAIPLPAAAAAAPAAPAPPAQPTR